MVSLMQGWLPLLTYYHKDFFLNFFNNVLNMQVKAEGESYFIVLFLKRSKADRLKPIIFKS